LLFRLDFIVITLTPIKPKARKPISLGSGVAAAASFGRVLNVASCTPVPSAEQMSSWVGTCPGREESAGISKTDQSPKCNRAMRRILNQVANAAVKSKGTVFEAVYRRLKPRLGHGKALWAVANRLCKLTWKILHQGVVYREFGQRPNPRAVQKRTNKLIRELRQLGYQVALSPTARA
jgi:transposase